MFYLCRRVDIVGLLGLYGKNGYSDEKWKNEWKNEWGLGMGIRVNGWAYK